ncbi:hypothetical protein PS914_00390 [Pseudomonas fluorescens]|nr:hypothetical protein PS914_00390 [Pseudomonas fluorescens]
MEDGACLSGRCQGIFCLHITGLPPDFWLTEKTKPRPEPGFGVSVNALFARASARDHSHSIVAGGLLDTSYVTREMPSISLMIRPLTVSSNS